MREEFVNFVSICYCLDRFDMGATNYRIAKLSNTHAMHTINPAAGIFHLSLGKRCLYGSAPPHSLLGLGSRRSSGSDLDTIFEQAMIPPSRLPWPNEAVNLPPSSGFDGPSHMLNHAVPGERILLFPKQVGYVQQG
jgi:hypothetical protein